MMNESMKYFGSQVSGVANVNSAPISENARLQSEFWVTVFAKCQVLQQCETFLIVLI
jgi:hypothetical protein